MENNNQDKPELEKESAQGMDDNAMVQNKSSYIAEGDTKVKKKYLSIALILLSVGLIIAVVFYAGFMRKAQNTFGNIEGANIVASVNGEELNRLEFDSRVSQARSILESQGVDFSSDDALRELNRVALDNLINERLLIQEAIKKGLEVSQEEVEKQYDILADQSGGVDKLLEELKSNNVSVEKFKLNIHQQMILRSFVDSLTSDIKVLDSEALQLYEDLVSQGAELPPFDEIQSAVIAEARQRKVAQALDPIIQELRSNAQIVTNI
jgi:hypothetical protein